MDVCAKVMQSSSSQIIKDGGPMGALAQAVEHFGTQWVGPAVWRTPEHETIELAEGTPAMLKRLLHERRKQRDRATN